MPRIGHNGLQPCQSRSIRGFISKLSAPRTHPADAYPEFRLPRHFLRRRRPSIAPMSVPVFPVPETAARTIRSASHAVLPESPLLPLCGSPAPGGCASRSRINSRVSNRAFRTGSGKIQNSDTLSQRQTYFVRCEIPRPHPRADLLQHSRQDECQRFDRRDFIIEIHHFHEPYGIHMRHERTSLRLRARV